jgi:hypothetical protein
MWFIHLKIQVECPPALGLFAQITGQMSHGGFRHSLFFRMDNMENYVQDNPPSVPNRRWILIALAAIFLLYFLQKTGCGPLRTEEKIEWIDR